MLVKPSISPGIYVFEHVQFSVSTELNCEQCSLIIWFPLLLVPTDLSWSVGTKLTNFFLIFNFFCIRADVRALHVLTLHLHPKICFK